MGDSLPAASSARQRRAKKITPLRQPDARQNNSNTQARQSEATDNKFDLDSPELYLNRELTWLDFTGRVLSMAEDPRVPLLERVKFLAIVGNNLDEFFMKRIGGLKQQVGAGVKKLTVDGRTPQQQIDECYDVVRDIHKQQQYVNNPKKNQQAASAANNDL